jgi:mono/diheme cytochrome c family protein
MNRWGWAALLALSLGGAGPVLAAEPEAATGAGHGAEVFRRWCTPCHAAATPLAPVLAGTSRLARRYAGTPVPAALEERRDLSEALIRGTVRHGLKSMPPFRKTEVSDEDLAALVAYLVQ